MKIGIATDHAGYDLKEFIKETFKNVFSFEDYGTYSKESADYPDFAHALASSVENNIVPKGILICGSGNGVAMTANKHKNVRAALCWTPEIALLARQHNDANILVLPARFVTFDEALLIINSFMNTNFEGGRHQIRVQKINIQ
jgi:ribose 5-phosphate isomerase B